MPGMPGMPTLKVEALVVRVLVGLGRSGPVAQRLVYINPQHQCAGPRYLPA